MADMNSDPFAAEPKPTKERPSVTDTSNDKVVVTLKGGSGFDAPWIVIHGSSAVDALAVLEDEALRRLAERTWSIARGFQGLAPAAAKPSSSAPSHQEAPGGQTRTCPHGEMQFKSGSKGGKTWSAFMCPTPKGTAGQCEPQWLR